MVISWTVLVNYYNTTYFLERKEVLKGKLRNILFLTVLYNVDMHRVLTKTYMK